MVYPSMVYPSMVYPSMGCVCPTILGNSVKVEERDEVADSNLWGKRSVPLSAPDRLTQPSERFG